MRNDTAKHILLALLAEKCVRLPEDADMREIIADALDCELVPGGLTRSLEEIFNATAKDSDADDISDEADEAKI